MADRIIFKTIKNREDDVLFLVNESESWSPISVAQVIDDIESNTHNYYSQRLDNPIMAIHDKQKGKYLRAKQNNELADNLDELDEVIGYKRPVFLGDLPSNKETHYSDSLQGVTHNNNQWFFTQLTKIHRLDIAMNRQDFEITHMPQELVDLGYDHFGDPDYVHYGGHGYLLVPIENGDLGSILGAFRDDIQNNKLIYLGFSVLEKQTAALGTNRAGWVAFNPINGLLHSSSNAIDRHKPVFRYAINFPELENGKVVLTPSTDLQLTERGEEHKIAGYMQGGCFSPDGLLYLAYGKTSSDVRQGISIFNAAGNLIRRSIRRKSFTNTFYYEVHPNFPKYQEVEGITYWNLDGNIDGQNSHKIKGQLHAILLNLLPGRDNFWFKHFRTEF